jgi:hypothetical protein
LAKGFGVAARVTAVSYLTAPAYLVTLRNRDRAGDETSGVMLRVVAQTVALCLFVACITVVFSGWVG